MLRAKNLCVAIPRASAATHVPVSNGRNAAGGIATGDVADARMVAVIAGTEENAIPSPVARIAVQCAPASVDRNAPVNGVQIGAQNALTTEVQIADRIVAQIADVTADADASSAEDMASIADIKVGTLRSAVRSSSPKCSRLVRK